MALLLRKASGKPVLASTRNTIQAFFRERGLGPRDKLDFRGFCDLYDKIGKRLRACVHGALPFATSAHAHTASARPFVLRLWTSRPHAVARLSQPEGRRGRH